MDDTMSVSEQYEGRPVRWTRGARKHRVGRTSARHVMQSVQHVEVPPQPGEQDARWWWIGPDERGRELEVAALDLPTGELLVIHVFPTDLRDQT